MYQSLPSEWVYMGNALPASTNYMTQSQSPMFQNPYAVPWQASNPTFISQPTTTQAFYPSQFTPSQSVLQCHYPTEQAGVPNYNTGTLDASPATTHTSLSTTVAGWPTTAPPEPTSDLPHVCQTRGCGRAYKRKAELDRHTQEKHGPTSGRLLCPVKMCPRGIPGEGFDRMSHLTQHLRSGKHKLAPQEAKFLAREHNPRKGGKNV